MIFLASVLAGLAALSLLLVLWQWLAARSFPLHQSVAVAGFSPGISILKPLYGCDDTTRESLQSWFRQTYDGPWQIWFGVSAASDPVCDLVRQLIAEHPQCRAQLVICENLTGANAKLAKLARLQPLAEYDLILVSDADVRVPPGFVGQFAALLHDPQTALATCVYRLANPTTLAMQWEAVCINADFWSQVLQSQTLQPLDFALGAAVLVRRQALAEVGGFAALTGCLADDYQLGHRLAARGHRLVLSPVVVECWHQEMSWRQVWQHQLRWARTIRVCQPVPYFLSLLSNATLWAGLWLACSLAVTGSAIAAGTAIAFLLLRILLAQSLQRRFTPGRKLVAPAWLVPVKDALQVALWCGAFTGNSVEWRGKKLRLLPDGTVRPID